jgi:hypothetical protein
MTATFMTGGREAATSGKDLEFVILDHGIGKEVVGDLVKLGFRRVVDLDLDRLSDPDGADSLEAQVLHGAARGDACGIKDGGFWHDGDNGFHKERKIGLKRQRDKMKMGKGRIMPNPED